MWDDKIIIVQLLASETHWDSNEVLGGFGGQVPSVYAWKKDHVKYIRNKGEREADTSTLSIGLTMLKSFHMAHS